MNEFPDPVIRAIDRGFWPRLMGYISAAAVPAAFRIVELAASGITQVSLSLSEAGQLLDLGQRARIAAKSWFAGVPIQSIQPPSVPLSPSPMIGGGEPGPYEIGLVANQGRDAVIQPANSGIIQFSSNCRGSIDDCIRSLLEYQQQSRGGSDSINQFITDIIDNWTNGNKRWLLPLWLVQRLD